MNNNIFLIVGYFWDCDYHEDIQWQYGYFTNEEDAKKVIEEQELEKFGSCREDEGYTIISVEKHKTINDIANEVVNCPRYRGGK